MRMWLGGPTNPPISAAIRWQSERFSPLLGHGANCWHVSWWMRFLFLFIYSVAHLPSRKSASCRLNARIIPAAIIRHPDFFRKMGRFLVELTQINVVLVDKRIVDRHFLPAHWRSLTRMGPCRCGVVATERLRPKQRLRTSDMEIFFFLRTQRDTQSQLPWTTF